MDTETRFDLDAVIAAWRRGLDQRCCEDRDIDEMEDHLRASVAALRGSGLSPEEAFLIGRHRLGERDALESEFAKINVNRIWTDRLLWMLVGVLVFGIAAEIGGLAGLVVGMLGVTRVHTGFARQFVLPGILVAGTELLFLAGLAGAAWWWVRARGGSFPPRARRAVGRVPTAVALVLGIAAFWVGLRTVTAAAFVVTGRLYPTPDVAAAIAVAGRLVSLAQILIVPAAIVWLARTRLRPLRR